MLKTIILKLSCLHKDDRESIIEQLNEEQKIVVKKLLAEVDDLGFTYRLKDAQTIIKQMTAGSDTCKNEEAFTSITRKFNALDKCWKILMLPQMKVLNLTMVDFDEILLAHADNPIRTPPKLVDALFEIVSGDAQL